ncbi:mercuric transport protein MerTP [Changchengzhania lutea]|uniref:mercuric transport protein MerTP n=1 Tax=Changchengzhania lutea TaxID=2049305 RepID=UPI00115C6D96|nr:mercuric transport protein MerTP [Changchengzhania lutea]
MAITKLNKRASMGTAVFSAVSLKLCCWGPLLLTGVAGISGSSVYFSWLNALKPYLLVIAFLSLGLAFYQVYKKKKVDDCDNCETDKPSFFKSKFYLWLVTMFVVVMTLVSYYPQIFHPTATKEIVATNNTDIQSVKLNVEGMVCSGCEENINHSVNKLDGIFGIKTSHIKGTSEIKFDTTKTTVSEIEEVIKSKGYTIKNNTNE